MIKRNPLENQIQQDKLYGIFRGVIEDNNDPDKMGRCKIRIWGVHTEKKEKSDKEGIPTDELPWSEPALSLFEGSVTGFGNFVVPLQGSHVYLFFENGHILQPRYFASIPGYPTDQGHGYDSNKEGFCDPNQEYPNESIDAPHKPNALDESDYHKLARNEGISDTIVQSKTSNKDIGVVKADGSMWSEPDPYYNAEYPNNKVISTHSGITIEIDDTNGEERIHIYHPSNSYIEINSNGDLIFRNEGDRYEIVRKDKNQHIVDNENKTIDGDRTKKIGKDQREVIGNSEFRRVNTNAHEIVENSEFRRVETDANEIVGTNKNESVGGNASVTITGNDIKAIQGFKNLTINGLYSILVNGPVSVTSATSVAVDAPIVNLNSGLSVPPAGVPVPPTPPVDPSV